MQVEFFVVVFFNKGQHYIFLVIIMTGKGPYLLGQNWLNIIKENWSQMFYIRERKGKLWQQVIEKYTDVFRNELGIIKGYTYRKVRHLDNLNPEWKD